MEASQGSEPRVIRLADAPEAIEFETTDLLSRLESQGEENGRLRAHADSLERVAQAERESRRRLAETLKRERRAAEALNDRVGHAEAELAARTEEAGQLQHALALSEQQKHLIWTQLGELERELAARSRSLWRKLLRRPPKA